jgi:uncharacterized protein (DUF433 family)
MGKLEITDEFEKVTQETIDACLAFAADKEHKLKIASFKIIRNTTFNTNIL